MNILKSLTDAVDVLGRKKKSFLVRVRQKGFESLLSLKKFNYLQKVILPRKALFNVTNICNARCVFCAYVKKVDPNVVMKNDIFRICCEQFSELQPNSWISLTPVVGEPFLDRGIFEKIEIAKRSGIKRVEIYSNSILLKRVYKKILQSELNELHLSFPDFNESEYEKIFRTTDYQASIEGMHLLLRNHKESGSNLKIYINLRSRRHLSKIFEEREFIKYVKPFLSARVAISGIEVFDNWAGTVEQKDLPDGMRMKEDRKHTLKFPCQRLIKLMFLANGDVKLCGCRFKNGTINDELTIGNIYKEKLVKIWYGEKVYELRNKFFDGIFPDVCLDCSHYTPLNHLYFHNRGNYFKSNF